MKLTKPCVYAAAIFSLLTISVPGQARDFDPPVVFSNDHFKVEINQILNHEEALAKKKFGNYEASEAADLGKHLVWIEVTVTMLRRPLDNNNVNVSSYSFQAVDDEGFVERPEFDCPDGIDGTLTVGRKARGGVLFKIDTDRELAEVEWMPNIMLETGEEMILTGRIPPEDKKLGEGIVDEAVEAARAAGLID